MDSMSQNQKRCISIDLMRFFLAHCQGINLIFGVVDVVQPSQANGTKGSHRS